jgi:hypothetical protein
LETYFKCTFGEGNGDAEGSADKRDFAKDVGFVEEGVEQVAESVGQLRPCEL